MLNDLDQTLLTLIEGDLPDHPKGHTFFEAPDSDFKHEPPALNFFLYDVRENVELRDSDWQLDRRERDVVKRRAPRRLDCSYLITAWAADTLNEHVLLGQVAQALLRRPVIAPDLIQGSTIVKQPLPTSLLHQGSLQSIGEFWQAMRTRPRVALNYTVTIAVEVFEPVEVPIATGREFRTGLAEAGPAGPRLTSGSQELITRKAAGGPAEPPKQ
ncbi:MAG: DUF4255 domain-containing protein [Chloroflexales bacterium]|nr:DUF4255 domain-containing protein [Chloroflexales bacterium]